MIKESIISNTINPDAYWIVNKKLSKFFGDPLMAIYLSNLISWREYFRKKGQLQEDGSFYTKRESIADELNIGIKKQTKMLSDLVKLNIVELKMKGMPPKQYKRIDDSELEKILSSSLYGESQFGSKRPELEGQNDPNNINKNKLNKSIINNTHSTSEDAQGKQKIDSFVLNCIDEWNKNPSVSKHKRQGTKTHLKIQEYIDQLRRGKFGTNKFFDKEWMKDRNITNNFTFRRFSNRQIMLAIKHTALIFKQGYPPRNKNLLPKNLPTIIYNPRTCKSIFLSILNEKPKPFCIEREYTDNHPRLTDIFKKYLEGKVESTNDDIKLVGGIKTIIEFRDRIPEVSLKGSDHVQRMFGDNISICKTYVEWLRKQESWLEPRLANINANSKLFFKFIKETESELYGYKLRQS